MGQYLTTVGPIIDLLLFSSTCPCYNRWQKTKWCASNVISFEIDYQGLQIFKTQNTWKMKNGQRLWWIFEPFNKWTL